jgi:hypothetical protein
MDQECRIRSSDENSSAKLLCHHTSFTHLRRTSPTLAYATRISISLSLMASPRINSLFLFSQGYITGALATQVSTLAHVLF